MYLLTNGIIITEEELLEGYDLLVQDGRIARIAPKGEIAAENGVEVIDAGGGYVTPGMIDIHSDYIEHMTAPRPTSLIDFQIGLRETEKELISHGITTMYHSLSIFKSVDYKYRPIREPENVRKLIDLIDRTHSSKHLIRHRFHARFEIDNLDQIDNLKSYITEEKVHLVSFMDHTPGQGQYRDLEVYKKTVLGYDSISEENIAVLIANHQTKEKLTVDAIREIAEMARERNIAIASHDDDSVEKLDLVQSFGTAISEFPITLDIARKAKAKGLFTVAGAPNVILGGSHSGNLSAAEAIADGCIDILCSDYYPAAMLHAVFQLAGPHRHNLVEMFKLVTLHPAQAVNIDEEHGSIRVGKKADLLIIERLEPDDFPVVTAVIVDGKLIQKTNYRI
ncbi:phosphonate metabolism protein PhnM [Paenibacillus aceris]|uniref:Alpha-D-ribose 1-methylphosphonate 5-triphosphate diphosphatase n=1 Tax=Paenibacillus aceris TaxID=869555 RepID=A0ABS4I9C5_9BACL|nr:phosphonate metabolism protein PhnM [Paenibacillus aceris]MBP1967518.1 alpha-D-ribose 1-methylphosphonate 5-triphosphate diphosphatase [Paenibacillus aceris]NHW35142.1 phosphonate metabolism protein PhnM [Paenibacillus aceris]